MINNITKINKLTNLNIFGVENDTLGISQLSH